MTARFITVITILLTAFALAAQGMMSMSGRAKRMTRVVT